MPSATIKTEDMRVRVVRAGDHRLPAAVLEGARLEAIAGILVRAGFKSFALDGALSESWLKRWGDLTFATLSALARTSRAEIRRFPVTHDLAKGMMAEARAVARGLGHQFHHAIDDRAEDAEKMDAAWISGPRFIKDKRAHEIEAVIGAVVELGRLTKTPTPHIETVYACVKLLGKTLGRPDADARLHAGGPGAHPVSRRVMAL